MTTVQLSLPDELAAEARTAGLLSNSHLEIWLREQLRQRRIAELMEAMDRAVATDSGAVFSAQDVAEEVRAMRAEQRAVRE